MKLFVYQQNDLNNYIQINLIDNPTISRWFNYCKDNQEISGSINNMPIGKRPKRSWEAKNHHSTQYQLLVGAVARLKQLPLPIYITFPEIPDTFNFNQHWCNDIHNIFVNIIKYLSSVSFHDQYLNPVFIEIHRVATQLNTLIHYLEYDSSTTATEKWCNEFYSHSYLQTFINTEEDKSIKWFEFTLEEQQLYHSSNHSCNVVFGNSILGKTHFVSFLQEEKITSPSISGITGTWGSIEILLDNKRNHIYNSINFKNWIRRGVVPLPTNGWAFGKPKPILLDFPIGNVDSSCDLKSFSKNIAGKRFLYKFKN